MMSSNKKYLSNGLVNGADNLRPLCNKGMRLGFCLRELETFVAIVDYAIFAAAGEAIGLTQSAISLQIKSLEATLDIQLFDRSKRPPISN